MNFSRILTIICLGGWIYSSLHSADFEAMLHEERRLYRLKALQEQKKIDELDYLFQTRKDIPESEKRKNFIEFKPGMRPHELKIGFIHSELIQIFHPHRLHGKSISDSEINSEIHAETAALLKEKEISLIFDESFRLKNHHSSPTSTYSSLNPKRISLTGELLKKLFQKHETPAECQEQVLKFLQKNIFDME
jgi:HD-GYP domain-containing protein (c-di-GMP phosphodiesterase class II)